jgi:hypothetical protein
MLAMPKIISMRLKIPGIIMFAICSIMSMAQQQNPVNVAPMLFAEPSATDDALSALLQQTASEQKPELVSSLIRLNLEHRLATGPDYLTKRSVAHRYAASIRACMDLPQTDQMPCFANLFDTLQPDILIQLALIDGGQVLARINRDALDLYTSFLKTGTRAQRNEAAQHISNLVEKYGQGMDLSNGTLLIPATLQLSILIADNAELINKGLTAGKREALAHTIAQTLAMALTYHVDFSLIRNVIAACAKHNLVFPEPDRALIIKAFKTVRTAPRYTRDSSLQRYIHDLDQELMNIALMRSLYNPASQDLFNNDEQLRNLDPLMNKLVKAGAQASWTDTMRLLQNLVMKKKQLFGADQLGNKLTATDAAASAAWLQSYIVKIALQLFQNAHSNSLQEIIQFMANVMPLESADTATIELYLLCAQTCLRYQQLHLTYDLLRSMLVANALYEDKTQILRYRTLIQTLFEAEIEHEDIHLIDNTIKHLIKPLIAYLVRTKQDAQAMDCIMRALKALRAHTVAAHNNYVFQTKRLTLLGMITERLLDVATQKDLQYLQHDLDELATQKALKQTVISRLNEQLEKRKNQPYLNNSVVRWMLNGLSRRKQ